MADVGLGGILTLGRRGGGLARVDVGLMTEPPDVRGGGQFAVLARVELMLAGREMGLLELAAGGAEDEVRDGPAAALRALLDALLKALPELASLLVES